MGRSQQWSGGDCDIYYISNCCVPFRLADSWSEESLSCPGLPHDSFKTKHPILGQASLLSLRQGENDKQLRVIENIAPFPLLLIPWFQNACKKLEAHPRRETESGLPADYLNTTCTVLGYRIPSAVFMILPLLVLSLEQLQPSLLGVLNFWVEDVLLSIYPLLAVCNVFLLWA